MIRRHGWSLMETLLVLAIASTLALAASGAMGRLVESARFQSESHQITASLALARSLAITRGKPVVVCPSENGRQCSGKANWSPGWMVVLDPEGLGQPRSDRDILDVRQRGPGAGGIKILTTSGRSHVRFQPNGAAGGTNLTLSLCSDKAGRQLGQVVVSRTGRTRTVREPGSEPALPCAHRLDRGTGWIRIHGSPRPNSSAG
jgi:type IV fimbrial biogenesis protein FimT